MQRPLFPVQAPKHQSDVPTCPGSVPAIRTLEEALSAVAGEWLWPRWRGESSGPPGCRWTGRSRTPVRCRPFRVGRPWMPVGNSCRTLHLRHRGCLLHRPCPTPGSGLPAVAPFGVPGSPWSGVPGGSVHPISYVACPTRLSARCRRVLRNEGSQGAVSTDAAHSPVCGPRSTVADRSAGRRTLNVHRCAGRGPPHGVGTCRRVRG